MASKIFWSEMEKAIILDRMISVVCSRVPFDMSKRIMVEALEKAQEELPKNRRKTSASLYSWIEYNRGEIEDRILLQIKGIQKEVAKKTPKQILNELVERELRQEDVQTIRRMEKVFGDAARVALNELRDSILAQFSAALHKDMEEMKAAALLSMEETLAQARKSAQDIVTQRNHLSTKPVERHAPKIVIVGCDSSQAQILDKHFGSKLRMTYFNRANRPPPHLHAVARNADKVFFMAKSAGAAFRQCLHGVSSVVDVNGGISTLRPLLENVVNTYCQ